MKLYINLIDDFPIADDYYCNKCDIVVKIRGGDYSRLESLPVYIVSQITRIYIDGHGSPTDPNNIYLDSWASKDRGYINVATIGHKIGNIIGRARARNKPAYSIASSSMSSADRRPASIGVARSRTRRIAPVVNDLRIILLVCFSADKISFGHKYWLNHDTVFVSGEGSLMDNLRVVINKYTHRNYLIKGYTGQAARMENGEKFISTGRDNAIGVYRDKLRRPDKKYFKFYVGAGKNDYIYLIEFHRMLSEMYGQIRAFNSYMESVDQILTFRFGRDVVTRRSMHDLISSAIRFRMTIIQLGDQIIQRKLGRKMLDSDMISYFVVSGIKHGATNKALMNSNSVYMDRFGSCNKTIFREKEFKKQEVERILNNFPKVG